MATPQEKHFMIKLADKIQSVSPSPTLTISALAGSMRAEGRDVLSFSAGEPDFATPEHVTKAAKTALAEGKTKYAPVAGLPALRKAIAERYAGRGFDVGPKNVVVSCGAKHTIYQLLQVLVQPGDEVIIPAPYWVSYPAQVTLAGGTPVVVSAGQDQGFRVTASQVAEAMTERTKVFILNSPCNPTGAVYSRDELAGIAAVCADHDVAIIYDAIYEELVYGDASFHEVATLEPRVFDLTITVNGLSKSHAMTGWRMGYMVGPAHVAAAVSKLQSQSTSGITTFVQHGAVTALTGTQEPTKEMRVHFDRRRQLMVDGLRSLPDVTCAEPQGAFYAFPSFAAWVGTTTPDGNKLEDDVALATYLLSEHEVALVPGSAFGAPGHQRLSYATSDDNIRRGIERIAAGLKTLSR